MSTDLELQLKAKYDQLASGAISYADFSLWFDQQQWPSEEQTDRMLESVELTDTHIKNAGSTPDDHSRDQLTRIGDYLHGRTDVKPASLGDKGMSQDELRHAYTDKHDEGKY